MLFRAIKKLIPFKKKVLGRIVKKFFWQIVRVIFFFVGQFQFSRIEKKIRNCFFEFYETSATVRRQTYSAWVQYDEGIRLLFLFKRLSELAIRRTYIPTGNNVGFFRPNLYWSIRENICNKKKTKEDKIKIVIKVDFIMSMRKNISWNIVYWKNL